MAPEGPNAYHELVGSASAEFEPPSFQRWAETRVMSTPCTRSWRSRSPLADYSVMGDLSTRGPFASGIVTTSPRPVIRPDYDGMVLEDAFGDRGIRT